jgi:hypothetical protein
MYHRVGSLLYHNRYVFELRPLHDVCTVLKFKNSCNNSYLGYVCDVLCVINSLMITCDDPGYD